MHKECPNLYVVRGFSFSIIPTQENVPGNRKRTYAFQRAWSDKELGQRCRGAVGGFSAYSA